MNTTTRALGVVVVAMVRRFMHQGQVIAAWKAENAPQGTGGIAKRMGVTRRAALAALRKAESDGRVVCCGRGDVVNPLTLHNAASASELYWQLSGSALAGITEDKS